MKGLGVHVLCESQDSFLSPLWSYGILWQFLEALYSKLGVVFLPIMTSHPWFCCSHVFSPCAIVIIACLNWLYRCTLTFWADSHLLMVNMPFTASVCTVYLWCKHNFRSIYIYTHIFNIIIHIIEYIHHYIPIKTSPRKVRQKTMELIQMRHTNPGFQGDASRKSTANSS